MQLASHCPERARARIAAKGPLTSFGIAALVAMMALSTASFTQANDHNGIYPLDSCPVTGLDLSFLKEPFVHSYDGREIRFCWPKCPEKFEADLADNLRRIDAEIIHHQKPFYPLTTCIVSGEELGGDMGPPVDYVYNNRLVRLCCRGCVAEYLKTPSEYLAILDKAVVNQESHTYPTDLCVVSGDPLDSTDKGPVDLIVGNRLTRVCRDVCVPRLLRNPAKYLRMLDDARSGNPIPAPFEGSHAVRERAKYTRGQR